MSRAWWTSSTSLPCKAHCWRPRSNGWRVPPACRWQQSGCTRHWVADGSRFIRWRRNADSRFSRQIRHALEQFDRQREDNGRTLVPGDRTQRLHITQLHGAGLAAEHFGGLHEFFRRLQFAFRVDHLGPAFAFRFCLSGDGADHRFVEVHVFDFDIGNLDAPGVGLGVEYLLDVDVQPFSLSQQFIKFVFTEHRTQGGLRQLAGGHEKIFDLNDCLLWIKYSEVQDCIDFDRDVIAGDHILRRDVEDDGAQVDPDHLLDHRNQQDQAGALDLPEASELEHHPTLVLAQDAER